MTRFRLHRAAALGFALATTAFTAQAAADSVRRNPLIPDKSCLSGTTDAKQMADAPEAAPALVEGLGYAGLEPDTANPEARAWFAQGVRLIWAFDEVEAVRAFQQAQRADPNCALCFMGEAWARGPTINLGRRADQFAAAKAAALRAQELSGNLSRRDQALVRGMVAWTSGAEGFDDAAFATTMETAALRMPEDDTLNIIAANARMMEADSLQPGSLPQRLLERVLARNPDHGGAIHYYIHLTDYIDRQHLAVPYAERLGRIAPAASHLVHMPSHTFYGVGRYQDAAAVNVAAVAADARFITQARPVASNYRFMLNRHNMHFAIESALARNDGGTALTVSRQYADTYLTGEVEQFSRVLGSATWYAHGLHGDHDAVMALPEGAHVFDKVLRRYARGEALARRGDGAAVAAEAAAIAAIREGSEAPGLGPGARLAELYQRVLEGRAAMLDRRYDAAAEAYRQAMTVQMRGRFSADPPIYWYSIRRSLAAALIASGDPAGARLQLHASLRRWPNDPVALYALSLADRALGDAAAAERNLARAQAVWAGDVTQVPLSRI